MRGRRRIGFEMKRTSAPSLTPSMHRALEVLRLDRLYAGKDRFPMHARVEVVPWTEVRAVAREVA